MSGNMVSRTKQHFWKGELTIVIILILAALLIRIPLMDYPIDGDAIVYAELAKNLAESGSYEYDGEVHTRYPPLHPLASSIAYMFTHKAAQSVKLISILLRLEPGSALKDKCCPPPVNVGQFVKSKFFCSISIKPTSSSTVL